MPVLSLLLAAVLALSAAVAYPVLARRGGQEHAGFSGILRLWQIDSFEGGTGSRGAFLSGVARTYEEQNEGVFVLVSAHTPASAANTAAGGEYPDLLSFGVGVDLAADAALPLRGGESTAGSIGAETYAVPWCRGQYFLFTLEGDYSDVNAQNTLLSQGRGVTAAAAYAAGLTGEFARAEPVRAYVAFLQGKYKYMLGSQRDVFRFQARGAAVSAEPLTGYCDLWQYMAVCSRDRERYLAACGFLSLLLSAEVQGTLSRIGMLPVCGKAYESGAMSAAERAVPEYTLNAFLTANALDEVRAAADAALRGDKNGAKKLKKFFTETL